MKSQASSQRAKKQPHIPPENQHATAALSSEPTPQLRSSIEDPQERITLRAYELYAQRGWREDHALDDWLDAEREILGLEVIAE